MRHKSSDNRLISSYNNHEVSHAKVIKTASGTMWYCTSLLEGVETAVDDKRDEKTLSFQLSGKTVTLIFFISIDVV